MLEKVASDPAGVSEAADLWLDTIKGMTVSPQSVAALTQFLALFSATPQADIARKTLANQQAMLADPAYQARLTGLAKVDSGGGTAAIPTLKKPWLLHPMIRSCWGRWVWPMPAVAIGRRHCGCLSRRRHQILMA